MQIIDKRMLSEECYLNALQVFDVFSIHGLTGVHMLAAIDGNDNYIVVTFTGEAPDGPIDKHTRVIRHDATLTIEGHNATFDEDLE